MLDEFTLAMGNGEESKFIQGSDHKIENSAFKKLKNTVKTIRKINHKDEKRERDGHEIIQNHPDVRIAVQIH